MTGPARHGSKVRGSYIPESFRPELQSRDMLTSHFPEMKGPCLVVKARPNRQPQKILVGLHLHQIDQVIEL